MKKRIISVIAGAMIATTVLSGCGKESNTPVVMEPSNEATAQATKEQQSDAPAEATTEENENADASVEASSEENAPQPAVLTAEDPTGYDSPNMMEGEALTDAELEWFSEFLSEDGINGFTQSTYRTPDKANLVAVFYNDAGIEHCDCPQEAIDEYLNIIGSDSVEYDLITLSGDDIRTFMEKKTGIKDFDVSTIGTTYLEDYDILIWQVSDCNLSKVFCYEGVRNGDLVQIAYSTDLTADIDRRITLRETGDAANPYQICSNRDLWETCAGEIIEAPEYGTDQKYTCAFESSNYGPNIRIIEDNAVAQLMYIRSRDLDISKFKDVKEIEFCDANSDGYRDMVVILSDGSESIAVYCRGYESEWEGFQYSDGKDSVTKWLSENVSDLTADNVIAYILEHQDELNSL